MDRGREEHLRKMITGTCMLAAPVCLLVADSLFPSTSTNADEMIADATGSTGAVAVATGLTFVAMVLSVGAVLGLAHMLHERRPGMALVGGATAITGAMVIGALTTLLGVVLYEAAQPGRDVGAMRSLVDDIMTGPGVIFGVATLFMTIGIVVLAAGLAKAHVVAPWSAACLAIAAVLLAFGNTAMIKPVILAGEAFLLAGLGSIGFVILGETDEEWEHVPEFHGFARSAATG